MKDKFIITISDINGSKQYTLSQFIKVIISWVIIAIVILFIAGLMIVKYLSSHVDTLEKDKQELAQQKEILIKEIIKTQENLQAMDEQLKEARKLIGLDDSDLEEKTNEFLKDRASDHNKSKKASENSREDKRDLTTTEYIFLTRLIPTGKPLKYKRISTRFGMRIHPVTKRKQFHSAVDLAADFDTPIFAPADGVVVYAGKKKFYGNFLLINHGLGFSTAYGHMQKIVVKNGDYVKKGDLVALCGSTGRSTGPHLHYELRYLSKWLDPEPFMNKWSYKEYKSVMKKNKQVKWDSMIDKIRDELELIKSKNKGE